MQFILKLIRRATHRITQSIGTEQYFYSQFSFCCLTPGQSLSVSPEVASYVSFLSSFPDLFLNLSLPFQYPFSSSVLSVHKILCSSSNFSVILRLLIFLFAARSMSYYNFLV